MTRQAMRNLDKKQWVGGDGLLASREALVHEAAQCSSTKETPQYFECGAAGSALSLSDSGKNYRAIEGWKEQYKSRDETPKYFLRRCGFFHHHD
jgi:hypothetical protein